VDRPPWFAGQKHLQEGRSSSDCPRDCKKPAYGLILHSPKPEENIASKKDLDGDKTGSGFYVSSAHGAERW